MAKRILVPISPREPAPGPDSITDVDGRVLAYADQETARLQAEATDYLGALAVALDGVPAEIAGRFGDPARAILAEADAFGADLIALGVRARRHVQRAGRVADQVAHRADVPVALFHAGRREHGGQ